MSFSIDNLYIYSLPEALVSSLKLAHFDESAALVDFQPPEPKISETSVKSKNLIGCSTCLVEFGPEMSQKERLLHYKSDIHRLNLKRALSSLKPLTEEEFDDLLERQSLDSISGSDESDLDSENESALETVFEKLSTGENQENTEESSVSHMNTHSPFIFTTSPLLDAGKGIPIYKSLFSNKILLLGAIMDSLKQLSAEPKRLGVSVLLMIGGGHFAGAVVSHTQKNIKGNAPNHKESRQEQMVNVTVSKTFHRYTTRRKQGGSQSASDNARGKANSAGSSIRRYNEQALQKEVRELLLQWKEYLDKAEYVFIRANGALNRKILVGYEGAQLKNDDARIRGFPFTTKRATLSEVKKAWVRLMYLLVVDLPKAKQETKKVVKEKKSKTPEVEVESESDKHTKEIIGLLKKSKAPILINYLKKNKLSADFQFTPEIRHANTPTPLHYASSQGLHHMIKVLLVNLKADPTISNSFGKTAAQIASNNTVKNAFQIARHSLGESYCDWGRAKVGPPKTSEEVAKEEEEAKRQHNQDTRKLIEEELAKKTELELKKPTFSSGGTLGGERPSPVSEMSGLSDQQKSRIMREQRARAAEARLKMLK